MTNRITWSRVQWGMVGRVNGARVGSIVWGNSSDKQRPYSLCLTLPGVSESRHTSEEAAQQHAEDALVLCIEGLGATFY